jgi:putative acetyltransferase
MSVHDDYQNQGIGTLLLRAAIDLAENWLNISRLELTVFVDNAPAIRLYEKHGFVKEGVLRRYAYRDGTYVDVYTMARIKETPD